MRTLETAAEIIGTSQRPTSEGNIRDLRNSRAASNSISISKRQEHSIDASFAKNSEKVIRMVKFLKKDTKKE
jgi:hypothetical protein